MFDYSQITEVPRTYEDFINKEYDVDTQTSIVLMDLFDIPYDISIDLFGFDDNISEWKEIVNQVYNHIKLPNDMMN